MKPFRSKILSTPKVKQQIAAAKKTNKKTKFVFTNGCFDLLHPGHVLYLEQAKKQGNFLIVALNADESVSKLKGPGRPVNRLADRMQVIAALQSVDFVVHFDEDTPVELLKKLKPDVYVKGGDWKVEDLPEAPVVQSWNGKVKTLVFVEGKSTTATLKRINSKRA